MNESAFLTVISMFNSYKLLAKAFHWSMTVSMNKHEQLDKLYDLIVDFQDNFVEEGIMLFGMPEFVNLQACSNISIPSDEVFLESISEFITNLKFTISESDNNSELAGLESLVDNFIHDLNIIQYRYQMN